MTSKQYSSVTSGEEDKRCIFYYEIKCVSSHAWHNSTQITLAHLHKKLTLSSLMRLGVLGSASHSVKKQRPVLLVYFFW